MASVGTMKKVGVYIGQPGKKPTASDLDPTTIAMSWGIAAGSSMGFAYLVSDLASQSRRIEDVTLRSQSTRQVELWTLDSEDARDKPLFWGEIVQQRVEIREGREVESLIARIEPYHFGLPLKGQYVWNNQKRNGDGEAQWVPIDIEFQPMIDGLIRDNRFRPTDNVNKYFFWIDPESARNDTATGYHGGEVGEWSLQDVVETLLWLPNWKETHIRNPKRRDIDKQIEDPPAVRNLILKRGAFVPDYLDASLHRHGYNWAIDMESKDGSIKPIVRFFKRGEGDEKTVLIQETGTVCDLTLTNTSELDVAFDVGKLANVVEGFGSLVEREFTIPLYRSWAGEDDGTHDHADPNNPIGRRWLANEGATHTGVRPEITGPPVFGDDWIVKRRVLEDCLTVRDGVRRPPFLEYKPSGGAWTAVPSEWGWRLSTVDVSIWFTGQRESEDSTSGGIPSEMLEDGVELRITGTLRGDTRPSFEYTRSSNSPNTNDVKQILDLSDRYFDRQRQSTGDYASVLTGSADTQDDTEALEDYVTAMARASEAAEVKAGIKLFGINTDYKIGDVITKVEGREISFNRLTSTSNAKYVQVVGITYNNGPQETILQVEPYDVVQA